MSNELKNQAIELINSIHSDRSIPAEEVIEILESISCHADCIVDALREELED